MLKYGIGLRVKVTNHMYKYYIIKLHIFQINPHCTCCNIMKLIFMVCVMSDTVKLGDL